ncbi:MAG: MotA/TolQ/ExbB proton channel family protein [Akkermansiaceae bacterium]|nr:MotA/TolQ/ExbB proton channel family protein [Akkermansiaceae bacterium]
MLDPISSIIAATETNSFSTIFETFKKGGVFMVPLAVTSVAGVMAMLYKFLSLTSNRVIPSSLAQRFYQLNGDSTVDQIEAARKECQNGASVLARLGAIAFKNQHRSGIQATQLVESAAREEVMRLHSGISVLDTVITIAPLLGLIGTASGLVTIFEGLGNNSDHLTIAQGIAEALTTTIFGLAIAVPCVIAHGYFVRRIEMLTARLESILADLISAFERPNPNA